MRHVIAGTPSARWLVFLAGLVLLLFGWTPAGALPPETYYPATVVHRGYVDDQAFGAYGIGFNFTYFGQSYSQFYVTSNGAVQFGSGNGAYSNSCLPDAGFPNAICAMWDDLVIDGTSGVIFYQTVGTAPNRKCVIQCTNMGFFASPVLLGTYSVILYEGSNDIQVQYRILVDPRNSRTHGASATIGLNSPDGSQAVQYSCNTASVSSEQALHFTPSGGSYTLNASGVYDGVLLGDALPPTIPQLLSPADAASVCTAPVFTWAAADNVTSYTFRLSTDPTLSGSVDTNVGTATTFTPVGVLSNGQSYYWAVFANGNGNTTWSEIHMFTADANAVPAATPENLWTALGSDLPVHLDGASCGATLTSTVTSLPAHGTLYQYASGDRGPVIGSVPTAVTDAGNRVIFTVNDGVVGANRGNFQFTVTSAGGTSGAATVAIGVYPAPSVSTAAVSALGTTTATCGGDVTADNGYPVTARGVCWNTAGSPTTGGSHTSDGTGTGAFTSSLTGLAAATTYHVRAYAVNDQGISYGSEQVFSTVTPAPVVTTAAVSALAPATATCGGNVTSDGGAPVTARGVCWGTSAAPTTADTHTADGTGTGAFTSSITGLQPATDYHVRAYATNSNGTGYGADVAFTTPVAPPTVSTAGASAVTTGGAASGGTIAATGGAPVTARGVCWGTSANPATSGSHTSDGTGGGAFTSTLTGLDPNVAYHVRAYATNSAGTAYGGDSTFTTRIALPDLTTGLVVWATTTRAAGGGIVNWAGGDAVTARGVCWSAAAGPTLADSHTTDGAGTGAFASSLTGLAPNSLYHVRAYATNGAGTGYGPERTFDSAPGVPAVTTSATVTLAAGGATCGGTVAADGGTPITARGVCWGLGREPGLSCAHTADGTGSGAYSTLLTGLLPHRTYYLRAYATNAVATAYGEEISFLSAPGAPIVTTRTPSVATSTSAACGGAVTDDQGAGVTARGVCWGLAPGPGLDGAHSTDGTGAGDFDSPVTGLLPGVTYHARAYATNSAGTGFGADVAFVTAAAPPSVTTAVARATTTSSATGGGNVTVDGGAPVTARGVCWSASPAPTLAAGHTTDGAGTGRFTSAFGGLAPNTTYYVRAYATNPAGTGYGLESRFTTGMTAPAVATGDFAAVGPRSATGGGEVTSDGGTPVTARGLCWGPAAHPSIGGAHTADGQGGGAFATTLTGLAPGTRYYARAYALNSVDVAYGAEVSFTTSAEAPALTTGAPAFLTAATASVTANVTSEGGSPVSLRGVCWATAPSPTRADSHTENGAGAGAFGAAVTGLQPATAYYLRAYAVNSAGPGYGNEVRFVTPAAPATLSAASLASVESRSAVISAGVASDGGAGVTERGVCFGADPSPSLPGAHVAAGAGPGSFTVTLNGLLPYRTYHVRPYATNAAGTAYGPETQFSTLAMLPAVSTTDVLDITPAGGTAGGSVSNDGGAPVSARGVCWAGTPNPTLADAHTSDGAGTGRYASPLAGLASSTAYYVRAYATNVAGTAYGNTVQFRTARPLSLPTVATGDLSTQNLGQTALSGLVTDDGGTPVLARGLCWGTAPEPNVACNHTVEGAGTGGFSGVLAGLVPGVRYYVRPYATNSVGTAYGTTVLVRLALVDLRVAQNPCRGTAAVQYALTQAGNVRLDIYDVTGRPVRHLLSARVEAGLWSTPWDGRAEDGQDARSGVYFVRLVAPDRVSHASLVLLR